MNIGQHPAAISLRSSLESKNWVKIRVNIEQYSTFVRWIQAQPRSRSQTRTLAHYKVRYYTTKDNFLLFNPAQSNFTWTVLLNDCINNAGETWHCVIMQLRTAALSDIFIPDRLCIFFSVRWNNPRGWKQIWQQPPAFIPSPHHQHGIRTHMLGFYFEMCVAFWETEWHRRHQEGIWCKPVWLTGSAHSEMCNAVLTASMASRCFGLFTFKVYMPVSVEVDVS